MRATTRRSPWARLPTGPPTPSETSTSRTRDLWSMRSKLEAFAGAAAMITALVGTDGAASAGEVDPMDFTAVDRGRYMSILSDCASCHTVPQKNQPFAGGAPDRNTVRQHRCAEYHARHGNRDRVL